MLDYQVYYSLVHSVTMVHLIPKMLSNEYVGIIHVCTRTGDTPYERTYTHSNSLASLGMLKCCVWLYFLSQQVWNSVHHPLPPWYPGRCPTAMSCNSAATWQAENGLSVCSTAPVPQFWATWGHSLSLSFPHWISLIIIVLEN